MADLSSRLDENVEEDCCPSQNQCEIPDPRTCYDFRRVDPNYRSRDHEGSSENMIVFHSLCDSGVEFSGTSESLQNFVRSGLNNTVERFKRLSCKDTEVEKLSSTTVIPSEKFDSGFRSGEALLDSGNLPYSTQETVPIERDIDDLCMSEELSATQRLIFEQDEDGDTQLHMAIIQMIPAVTELFIKKAWNAECVNLSNTLRQSPLHLSVIINQPETAYNLLAAGALLEQKDNKGNTPLHIACKEGFLLCVQVLTIPIQPQDACQSYRLPEQQIPQNLEIVNYEGKTCLHLAADNYLRPKPDDAYLQIIKHLLKIGADVNARDGKSGRTILHYCAEYGNMELLYVILRQPGVNLDAKTYDGKTALMLAHGRGFQLMVERLLQVGAQPPPEGMDSHELDSSEDMSEDEDSDYCDIHINGTPVAR